MEIIKKYKNDDITVIWKPEVCIHSQICFNGLPKVFNPQNRPWVNIEGSSSKKIIDQIDKCPSGALSYLVSKEKGSTITEEINSKQTEGDKMDIPKAAAKEPVAVNLEAGKKYAWCKCGLSINQPFCYGSHKGTQFSPVIFEVDKSQEAYLCQCKQTSNAPYCDGSHNKL